jgi:putative addiction module killer protein
VEAIHRKRKTYKTKNGAEPFLDWIKSVRGIQGAVGKVLVRLKRAEEGNFGDHEPAREGVIELKIGGHGPGHRVYIGIDGEEIILLWGGDKKTQDTDIRTAIGFWRDYNA